MVRFDPPGLLGVFIAGILLAVVALLADWPVPIVYAATFVAIIIGVVGYARWDERHRP
jgi:hypothetical protein